MVDIYSIVREQKDETEQRLNHEFEATVSWSVEPSRVHGDHPVARRVAGAYRDLRGKIVADDWSSVITADLEQDDAARVRGDGRVYRSRAGARHSSLILSPAAPGQHLTLVPGDRTLESAGEALVR